MRRQSQYAYRLRGRGVGPENRVRLYDIDNAAIFIEIKKIERDTNAPLRKSSEGG